VIGSESSTQRVLDPVLVGDTFHVDVRRAQAPLAERVGQPRCRRQVTRRLAAALDRVGGRLGIDVALRLQPARELLGHRAGRG